MKPILQSITVMFIIAMHPVEAGDGAVSSRPSDFVEVKEWATDIHVDLKYATRRNFTGDVVPGYEDHSKAFLTQKAAEALSMVQKELRPFNLSLVVYDAYRPQRAVDFFVEWVGNGMETDTRSDYFPSVRKADLIRAGYIAAKSGHSRGSTVDVSLVGFICDDCGWTEKDMGTPFDYFDLSSRTLNPNLKPHQRANRLLLKTIMEKHGFRNYPAEWWHFSLVDEPYPDTYFDFPIR